MSTNVSIIIPARNEASALRVLLPEIRERLPDSELIVVNDGSTDDTASIARQNGANVISHPYSMGNGAAVKSGARAAAGEILVFLDGDGQHDPADITRLLARIEKGHYMAVGARSPSTHASLVKRLGNKLYNRIASLMTGYRIEDLTSGFRAVRAKPFRNFLYLLPNGFSYPTTITMAFFRCAYPVAYVPIAARQRAGSSHIRLFHDGFRFFLIILKIGALFSPMRFFLPISTALFFTGVGYYAYTYAVFSRFTNMSALLMLSGLFTFLIGLLAEQVSSLHYRNSEDRRRDHGFDSTRHPGS